MMTSRILVLSTVVAAAMGGPAASAAVAPAFPFKAPTGWNVGQPLTSYQEWAADAGDRLDGVPNVGFNDAGAGLTPPTLSVGHTGFVASSGGAYSFSDWYTLTARITAPTAGVPAGAGTYLVVQTFASINDDDGAGRSGTVQGIDLLNLQGAALPGVVHVRSDTHGHQSNFPSPFGPVDVQATIDEFWIPHFAGTLDLVVEEIVHSSFMGMRVDAIVSAPAAGGSAPFSPTPVPEPASLAVLGCGLAALMRRRVRR